MQMLRLPSDEHLNADLICRWGELKESNNVWDKTTLKVSPGVYLDVTFVGNIEWQYNNADARALYMWLERNSVAIGEDGRETARRPLLTHHQIRTLTGLRDAFGATYSYEMSVIAKGIAGQEFDFLIDEHYIEKETVQSGPGTRYAITAKGRAAIEGK